MDDVKMVGCNKYLVFDDVLVVFDVNIDVS